MDGACTDPPTADESRGGGGWQRPLPDETGMRAARGVAPRISRRDGQRRLSRRGPRTQPYSPRVL
eukprot:356524-Chlamydomonas_euryale.AAC.6